MDRELPDDERAAIRELVLKHDGVLGMHDLRTRSSGLHVFIQFHLELDGEMKLKDAPRNSRSGRDGNFDDVSQCGSHHSRRPGRRRRNSSGVSLKLLEVSKHPSRRPFWASSG